MSMIELYQTSHDFVKFSPKNSTRINEKRVKKGKFPVSVTEEGEILLAQAMSLLARMQNFSALTQSHVEESHPMNSNSVIINRFFQVNLDSNIVI